MRQAEGGMLLPCLSGPRPPGSWRRKEAASPGGLQEGLVLLSPAFQACGHWSLERMDCPGASHLVVHWWGLSQSGHQVLPSRDISAPS